MKQPKKLEPPKQVNDKSLFVEVESRTTSSYQEAKEWGEWADHKESSIGKVSKTKDRLNQWNFYDYKVPDEVYEASIVYVVYVKYSTGDTFGRSTGNITVAFITEKVEEAQQVQKAILDQDEEERGSYYSYGEKRNEPKRPWDKLWRDHPKSVQQGYSPWNGYFESVEDVGIEVKVVSL